MAACWAIAPVRCWRGRVGRGRWLAPGPYLTLFSRAGLSRAEIDKAVADVAIHELPAARGCTYVLPSADYPLGLKVGQTFTENENRAALKLGVTAAEIAKLRAAILKALAGGPLEPDAIRTAVGPAARNLGPEGVKKGITTTLPVALGSMQSEGEIRRISLNGRLDQQRYKYALWKPNPLAGWKLTAEQAFVELARRYFAWTGGASLAEFQWFSGLSGKAAKVAVEPLGLEPLEAERLMLPEDREAFEKFQTPKHPQYAVVSSLDGINQLRRELKSLVAPEDQERVGLEKQKSVVDLSNHAIFDRGRLVGLWAFDTETGDDRLDVIREAGSRDEGCGCENGSLCARRPGRRAQFQPGQPEVARAEDRGVAEGGARMSRTAFLADPIAKKHDTGAGHPEQIARWDAAVRGLGELKLTAAEPRAATFEELALCHAPAYIRTAKRDVEAGLGSLSTGDTDISRGSFEAAVHAAGVCLNAVDLVMQGEARNAFCIVRPPGHHARPAQGMGFCLFNNIAIAARYAQQKFGVERVAIADWDVHHGNGTQDIFYTDRSVFFFSTHQSPWYPGTGDLEEIGEGPGKGTTLNCPYPAGSGRDQVLGAFRGKTGASYE